ncbi:MAG: acyltransferase family protein [Hyphomicrobium sp.]
MPGTMGGLHRPDIDGLRAVAVAGVVAYHLDLGGVTGGYGGVDVFFVISGFLIAGIIHRELTAGTFSIANFYVRRIRRIVPAFVLMAVVTTIAAALFLFPDDFKEYGNSLLAAATSTSNFHFMQRNGYFDGVAIQKPLLHTWSLAVEEQFYAVFPILVVALFKARRKIIVAVLAVIALASLAISARGVELYPAQAFFSTPGRVWELLLGAIIAFGAVPVFQSQRLRELEAVAGLLMIAAGYFVYTDATAFPGLAALPFCLGTAMIIHAGIIDAGFSGRPTFVARALSLAPVAGLGLISYSVYLFHWPLIVFARYRFPDAFLESHTWLSIVLAGTSVVLGYLSWRFVEVPFRKFDMASAARRSFAPAGMAMVSLVLVAIAITKSDGWPGRWSPNLVTILASPDVSQSQHCKPIPFEDGRPSNVCRVGAIPAATGTLLWGDSHAEALLAGFALESTANGHGVVAGTSRACPPLVGVILYGRSRSVRCQAFANAMFERALAPEVTRVILIARWAAYAEGVGTEADGLRPVMLSEKGLAANPAVFAGLLKDTVVRLAAAGREVVIVGPVPEPSFNVAQSIARNIAWGQALPPDRTVASFEKRQRNVLPVLSDLEHIPNVRVVYPHQWMCDEGTCRYRRNLIPLYRDTNHLTEAGVAEIQPMFEAIFARTGLGKL